MSFRNFELAESRDDDLIATEAYYQKLLASLLPQNQAIRLAEKRHQVTLDASTLNEILGRYMGTSMSLEECVRQILGSGHETLA